MKKNLIAVLLSLVLTIGGVSAPVFAAEVTTAQEAVEDSAEGITQTESAPEEEDNGEEEFSSEKEGSDEETSESDTEGEDAEEETFGTEQEDATEVQDLQEDNADSSEETVANSEEDEEKTAGEVNENELVEKEEVDKNRTQEERAKTALEEEVIASGECGENAIWTLYKNHLFVVSGSGEMTNYNPINNAAPAPWNSYKDDIYEVVIEDGITSIGDYSFFYYDEILTVSIPDSVRRIGNASFIGCTGLTSVAIPDAVTEIGGNAFCECSEITEINIPENVESIGSGAFSSISKWNVDLYLSDKITYLGGGAFSGCSGVRSVRISHSLTEIEGNTFLKCSITEIDIPDNITSIGINAFSQTLLEEVTIPGSVKSIGESAFEDCYELKKVVLSDGVEEIGVRCFRDCKKLNTIILPEGITIIPEGAFAGTRNLANVTIPDSVTKIDYCAFQEGVLALIEIPESVKYIGAFSFSIGTRIVYYGTQKHWDKIENYSDYGKVYCVTQPVAGLQLDKEECIVEVGKDIGIDSIIYPNDASCPLVYWSINDEDVATCGSPTYMGCSVHGNEVGSAILTAESVDGGYSASCKITVVTHCVTGISIPDEESEVSLGIGLSKQVQANVLPENADNQNIIWSSSNPDIVSVDDNGVITGVGNGSATITATTDEGGYQATCNVSTYVPVSDIELSESSLILAKGSSQIVYAAVSPDNVDEEHRKLKYDVTTNDVVRVRYFYDNDPQGCLIIGYETGQTRVEVSTAEGHVKNT